MNSIRLSFLLLCLATAAQAQNPNNTLRGKVLYQSSGNKPAVGVRIAEPDANPTFSVDNGEYLLKFQNKRNGSALALEVGKDDGKSQKLELVNEKEVKAAKLPANLEEVLDIIVCPAGQRDIAAQKYYRILRTTADRELEKKKKKIESLLAQKEKDYQKISDLFAQLDGMQAALDSAKIREQAFNIASINLDRASQMVKDAVKKIEEENDVEGALRILSVEALDTAYQIASALKKKAEEAIQQVIEGYEFKISLLEPQFRYGEIAECYNKMATIYKIEKINNSELAFLLNKAAYYWGKFGNYQKQLSCNLEAVTIQEKVVPANNNNLIFSYISLSESYFYLSNYPCQLEVSAKALAIAEESDNSSYSTLAQIYNQLAMACGKLGEHEKALDLNQKAILIQEKGQSEQTVDLAKYYFTSAWAYRNLGAYENALEYNLKALEIWEKLLLPGDPDLAFPLSKLALVYGYLGNHNEAIALNLRALNIREKVFPPNHPLIAQSYFDLGLIYQNIGNFEKALEYNLRALDIRNIILSPEHSDLNLSYINTGSAYAKLHQFPQAKLCFEKFESANYSGLAFRNWAMYYALQNDKVKALENLQKAISLGYKDLKWIETDDSLESIRGEQGYKEVEEQLKKQ